MLRQLMRLYHQSAAVGFTTSVDYDTAVNGRHCREVGEESGAHVVGDRCCVMGGEMPLWSLQALLKILSMKPWVAERYLSF